MREPPSPVPMRGRFVCSDSAMFPLVDGVAAAYGLLLLSVALPAAAEDPHTGATLAEAGAAIGVPFLISAIHGVRVRHRCRDAHYQVTSNQMRRDFERRTQASWLVETAIRAAHDNDCATALALESTIRWLDPTVDAQAFASNEEIRHCVTIGQPDSNGSNDVTSPEPEPSDR